MTNGASTELTTRDATPDVVLFPGATPDAIIAAATEAADKLSGVIKAQGLSLGIRGRQHVLIEGWQTLGSMTGVFAVRDVGVTQLPWPTDMALPSEVPTEGAALKAYRKLQALRELQAQGLAYGFTASFRAEKDGAIIGWGEGRCTRAEDNWTTKDDYALSSQAQTRGQSRALAAPLRFIVKLAGYDSTPAEEMDGATPAPASSDPFGPEVNAAAEADCARTIQQLFPSIDGPQFVAFVNQHFGTTRLPQASARMVAAIQWAISHDDVHGNERTRET